MISDLEKKRRREAVIDTLASLAGSAQWLAVGSRGHNLSTVLHCIAEGLVSQRSPTAARVFDLTQSGWALAKRL
ncbi:hypothetical protein ACSBOB_01395 [Mesorhizobium sp. ASY16-5R]|uniref:hypothetical protein n=1 Tax=Mesorhizobium sp. ASY16-5R TaxID=3445772 RepID=UPI003FA04CB0